MSRRWKRVHAGWTGLLLAGLAWTGASGVPRPATAATSAVDTIRAGSRSLQPQLLQPGSMCIRSYKLASGVETPVSRTRQTVELGQEAGVPVVRIRTVHASGSDTTRTLAVVRQSDLALMHIDVRATRDSSAVTVNGLHLTGWSVLPEKPARLLDLELPQPIFPTESQIPWLQGLLPLVPGYVAAIPHFSQWDGYELWRRIEVQAEETIRVAGEEFDCWRVDAGPLGPPGYRATRWIDKKTRRVVQSALRGEPGKLEYWGVLETEAACKQ
jgi:hypothetical protein